MCDLVCMAVWLWEREFPRECVRLNPFLHLPFVLNLALSSYPGLVLSGAPLERLCFQDTDFGSGAGEGGSEADSTPQIPYVTQGRPAFAWIPSRSSGPWRWRRSSLAGWRTPPY